MVRGTKCLDSSIAAATVLVLCMLLLAPTLSRSAQIKPGVHFHRWVIEYGFKSPDCVEKLAITVNGETPGPAIVAEEGDRVLVNVTNKLITENIAIHWHGIRQIGTPWSDGTEAVTQCPISPGETFLYDFYVDRPGTYVYHAHYGIQKSAGLYGLIQVNTRRDSLPSGEPFNYTEDHAIILNDWWHRSIYEQATMLSSVPFHWIGEPQSLMINGRGKYDCAFTRTSCNASHPECSPYTLTVKPGMTYRLRIGNIASLSSLSFQIESHDMTVVEADGHFVKPFTVKNLYIYPGETYSVTLKADQNPSRKARNYWATTNVVGRRPATPVGAAVINYYPNSPTRLPPTAPPEGPKWDDVRSRVEQSLKIRAHQDFKQVPPAASDRTILLLNTQNKIDGKVRWAINNVSLALPETPYLVAMKHNLSGVYDLTPPPEGYDYKNYDIYGVAKNTNATMGNAVYRLAFGSTVDVVLQNANTMNVNDSETHPWHLHGHDFWVLGYGDGKFDPEVDVQRYNLVDPVLKNTVPLHPYGWTAIRFQANNSGVWAFHCHIEAHFLLGMGVVFEEGVERVGKLPGHIMGCGATRGRGHPFHH